MMPVLILLITTSQAMVTVILTLTYYYMEEMIQHKVVTGLVDPDILQDVLASDLKSLEETVVFVDSPAPGAFNEIQRTWENCILF